MVRFRDHEIQVLLLDLDDTLLDNRSGLRKAWSRVAELIVAREPAFTPEDVRQQILSSTRWFWDDPERHRGGRLDLPWARRTILGHVLGSLGRPDPRLVVEAERLYTELRDATLEPIAGAFEALARLRRLVPRLGLVTNGAAVTQRAKIDRFDLARHFDAIVIEGEFGAGKPEAQVFAHALGQLGGEPPTSCMAGDNYEADVLGALHAGLHAVWIDPEGAGTTPVPPPRPHARVRSIVELAEQLRD